MAALNESGDKLWVEECAWNGPGIGGAPAGDAHASDSIYIFSARSANER